MHSDTSNPWRTLSVRTMYENPWVKVTHREVMNPSGNPGIYGVVHFKNIAIAIVPIDEEEHTWLVGQYRYTLDAYSWEVPEGGCPKGTEPLEGAKRELLEETGIIADTWMEIGQVHTSNSVTDERGIIYVAKNLRHGLPQPEDSERLEIRRLPLLDAVGMAMSGEITDALSVAALLKVYIMKQNGKL